MTTRTPRMTTLPGFLRVGSATTMAPARTSWHLLMVKEKNTLTCVKIMSRWLNTNLWKTPQGLVQNSFPVNYSRGTKTIDSEIWERNQKIWKRGDALRKEIKRQRQFSLFRIYLLQWEKGPSIYDKSENETCRVDLCKSSNSPFDEELVE